MFFFWLCIFCFKWFGIECNKGGRRRRKEEKNIMKNDKKVLNREGKLVHRIWINVFYQRWIRFNNLNLNWMKRIFFFIRIHHRSSGQNDAWWLNTGQTNRISENITQKNSCNFLNFYCQKNKKLPVSFFHFIYLFGRKNFFLIFHFILFQSNIFIHIIDFLLDLFSLSFLVHVFFYFCIIVGTFGILSLKNHQWNQKYTIQIDRLNVICNFKIYKHLNG